MIPDTTAISRFSSHLQHSIEIDRLVVGSSTMAKGTRDVAATTLDLRGLRCLERLLQQGRRNLGPGHRFILAVGSSCPAPIDSQSSGSVAPSLQEVQHIVSGTCGSQGAGDLSHHRTPSMRGDSQPDPCIVEIDQPQVRSIGVMTSYQDVSGVNIMRIDARSNDTCEPAAEHTQHRDSSRASISFEMLRKQFGVEQEVGEDHIVIAVTRQCHGSRYRCSARFGAHQVAPFESCPSPADEPPQSGRSVSLSVDLGDQRRTRRRGRDFQHGALRL